MHAVAVNVNTATIRSAPKENVIPLAGEWRFELDRKDVGVAEGWFDKELSRTIRLPGSVSTRNLGDPITGIRQQIWGGKFADQPLWHPMIRSDYRVNAWYQIYPTSVP